MSEQETYELFDAYLRGELSGKELDDFVRRTQEDSAFKEALDLHVMLARGIEEHRKQELKAYLKSETSKSFLGNPFGAKYTWFAAAVIAFFAVVYVGFEYILKDEFAQLQENTKSEQDTLTKDQIERTKPEIEEPNEFRANAEKQVVPPPPVQIEVIEDDMEVIEEVDGAYLGEAESEMEEITLDAPESANLSSIEENRLPVKQDTRLYDTQMVVNQIAWSTDSLVVRSDQNATAKRSNNVTRSELKVKESSDKKITIEFWGSPINYKGYRFDGRKLVLFGQDEQSEVHVTALLTDVNLGTYRYFFKLQGSYYELFDDNVFRPYKAITDSRLLTKLP